MKLFTFPYSSNARKVLLTARSLGISLDEQHVALDRGEQKAPDYLALNPNGAVPVLVDGDFVLTESNAIMMYLCEGTPRGHTLYPSDPRLRATVHRWLFWQSNHWSPAISGMTFENVLKARMNLGEPDPAQIARHERFFRQYATVLDAHLARHMWVVGIDVTLAEFALAAPLMYAGPAKLPVHEFPHVMAWFERVKALPAWISTEP